MPTPVFQTVPPNYSLEFKRIPYFAHAAALYKRTALTKHMHHAPPTRSIAGGACDTSIQGTRARQPSRSLQTGLQLDSAPRFQSKRRVLLFGSPLLLRWRCHRGDSKLCSAGSLAKSQKPHARTRAFSLSLSLSLSTTPCISQGSLRAVSDRVVCERWNGGSLEPRTWFRLALT
jgi:hypothetical protein